MLPSSHTDQIDRGLLQLAGASSLQHYGDVIAPLLTNNAATVVTGDLTPTSIARRFISHEWFKYVLFVCCSLLFVDVENFSSNLTYPVYPVLLKW